ncbi:MAG: cyclomaltodextrinase N-terminal domain-containing protein, partial [Muribaculaceae bacterium]|nr:cyclomaltodextrinase N-terminal domain-containing protein [Muribaculaceae bacterium]
MKLIKAMALGIAGAFSFGASAAPNVVSNVEPPYWWTGMACDTLQIMLTGPDIARADFSVDYSGVTLCDQLSLDSPNYKFLYLVIGADARPGTMQLRYSLDGKKSSQPYELKARAEGASTRGGFDAGDVLYLLMPDRFAKGLDDSQKDISGLEYPAEVDRSRPNSRHGGDMRGIRNHLDYIDSLGVTAIW